MLDGLFDRLSTIPARHVVDLAPRLPAAAARIPDVNNARYIESRLRRTGVYRRAGALAREILGPFAFCSFDHAIYKPAHNDAATPWHQDHAYVGLPQPADAIHIWIPLQAVDESNGCMWFIPGSHRAGPMSHRRVAGTAATLETVDVGVQETVCCRLPLGGASVHTPLTLHMTGPNRTDRARKAWILHFASFGRAGFLKPANAAALFGVVRQRFLGKRS